MAASRAISPASRLETSRVRKANRLANRASSRANRADSRPVISKAGSRARASSPVANKVADSRLADNKVADSRAVSNQPVAAATRPAAATGVNNGGNYGGPRGGVWNGGNYINNGTWDGFTVQPPANRKPPTTT